jgi:hypothetical protein
VGVDDAALDGWLTGAVLVEPPLSFFELLHAVMPAASAKPVTVMASERRSIKSTLR